MPAWRDLSEQEVADLGAFVAQQAQAPPDIKRDPVKLAAGATVYASNCALCHGVGGAGDGAVARSMNPRPLNFIGIEPNPAEVAKALANGVPGTSMPPFLALTPADRKAVTAFVESLYRQPFERGH